MKKNNVLLLVICCLIYAKVTFAQTVSWQKELQWNEAEWLCDGLLRVEQNGKWGLVRVDGTQVVSCTYSKITKMNEKHFLLLDENHKVLSIGDETGKVVSLGEAWYADSAWPYFSGGLLAVKGGNGLWGYLDFSGSLVIKNQYKNAFPFFYGHAVVCYVKAGGNVVWQHIDTQGNKLIVNNKKLQSSDAGFASSFTRIGDKPLAVALYGDRLVMFDEFGRVQDDPINSEGAEFVGKNGMVLACSQKGGPVKVELNSIVEIVSMKTGPRSHSCHIQMPDADNNSFPNTRDIEISPSNMIKIGQLRIASQFQEIYPITSDCFVVKQNNLWGVIRINRNQPFVTIRSVQKKAVRLEHRAIVKLPFELSSTQNNIRVYVVGHSGEREYVAFTEPGDRTVLVPMAVEDGCLRANIGLEMNGILLEPEVFSVPVIVGEGFGVTGPSDAVIVDDKGRASFKVKLLNRSKKEASAPIDVTINGKTQHFNGIKQSQSINVNVDMHINLGVQDELIKNVIVIIKEEDLPEKSYPVNIKFVAPIIQEQ